VSFGSASLLREGCRAVARSAKADIFRSHETRTGYRSQKHSGTAALSAISDKGTGPADLSAEAPKARRPM